MYVSEGQARSCWSCLAAPRESMIGCAELTGKGALTSIVCLDPLRKSRTAEHHGGYVSAAMFSFCQPSCPA